jgi:bifunctional UDP-N-acetylglucosamine pyrophosphorylase/glucosamine-1-phosphate N-acetyltransferase
MALPASAPAGPCKRAKLKNINAIVLAAGQGKRMRSDLPKVLHRVGGRPMLDYPVRAALAAGADPVVVVVGVGREAVEEALAEAFPEETASGRVRFATQAEQRGTADAVASGVPELGATDQGTTLILYGDVPNLDIDTVHELLVAQEHGGVEVAVTTFLPEQVEGYGRIVRDEAGEITSIVEHADCDEEQLEIGEANAGIYAVATSALVGLTARLATDNAQGELYLTDLVAEASAGGRGVVGVMVEEPAEVEGVNDPLDLTAANSLRWQLKVFELLESGVTVMDPGTTYVDDRVRVAPGAVLHPGVILRGATSIGPGSVIDAYSVLDDARVGAGCSVGPFARLRQGTDMRDGSKVGNFVETKKTVLGEGSKANHLTYLGDTTVGAKANIGAGTITCNYDGQDKHRTHIGDGAFIGSDVQLVAPVTVGDGAIVGAGTTVTRNVPDGALAISRVPQRDIEGYAERLALKRQRQRQRQRRED